MPSAIDKVVSEDLAYILLTSTIHRRYASRCILLPGINGGDAKHRWAHYDKCRWGAPPGLVTIRALKHIYTTFLGQQRTDSLASFFQHTLSIPDASCEDVINELILRKNCGLYTFEGVIGMYEYLSEMNLTTLNNLR